MINNKENKPYAQIPYNQVNFRWVSNHYDIHLHGSCIYNNELCEFKCKYPNYNLDTDEWDDVIADIYKLNPLQKLKWYWDQWLFETCVGYHWTYPYRKQGIGFDYRKPKWLYKKLFKWYFNITAKKKKK